MIILLRYANEGMARSHKSQCVTCQSCVTELGVTCHESELRISVRSFRLMCLGYVPKIEKK
jgi:hypothetical protein